jgi:zinc protease
VNRAAEPTPRGLRALVVHDDVKEAHLSLSFPIPGIDSPDLPALDALAVILGQGESSRLELAVRRARKVNDAHAYAYTPKDPGLLAMDATLEVEQLDAAIPALLTEAYRLREELVEPAELASAQSLLESDGIYQRETVQGLARRIGFFETVAGGDEAEVLYQKRVAALTPQQIREVARKYIDVERCAAVALVPQGAPFDEAKLRAAITAAQTPGARAPSGRQPEIPFVPSLAAVVRSAGTASKVQKHVLPNGVTVLLKPEEGVPLIALRAVLPGGLLHETDADNGIHQLLGRTITLGTATRTAEEIARLSDAMAGSISGNAGRNSIGLRAEFLSRHLDRAFDLFADSLLHPAFHDEEVARERAQQLQSIKTREDHPSGVAFRLFNRALYGAHPYHLDQQGELQSVEKLDPAALKAAHSARLQGKGLVVSAVGEMDPDKVLALCRERFGTLPAGTGGRPQHAKLTPPSAPVLAHQDAKKAQAHVVYGFLGVRIDEPERYALEVLSSVLSGQGGRLFIELRDKRSMAYSVSSFSLEGIDPGYFAVYMGTSPEKVGAATAGIRVELAKIRDERIGATEIDRARSYLIGSHAIGLQKHASRAAVIALDELYGLGAENHLAYEQKILAVDAEAVRNAAQRVLRLDRAVLAVLGPRPADDWATG